jgi:hypothetical protein
MTRARDVANIDGLLTTTGDTYYASAAGTPARLGVGTTGQVMTVASGVPSWATPAGGGKVLQVVQATKTAETSTTSTTLADSGLSVSITPSSATSKILVIATMNGVLKDAGNVGNGMRIVLNRDSTKLSSAGELIAWDLVNQRASVGTVEIVYLDSPASTSALTYKTQWASAVSGQISYFNHYNTNNETMSTITAMEIGA